MVKKPDMNDVKIELASPADDEQLKKLQAGSSMPGPYQISYLREPSFFKALHVEGTVNQVIVGRDSGSGSVIGWGNRSIKQVYVNDEKKEIGYLSGLRFVSRYNNVFTLMRGYEKLHQLHEDGRAPFYLTTILDHNLPAQKLLLSGKRKLPRYHNAGQFHCKAVNLARIPCKKINSEASVRFATHEDLDRVIQFLNQEGRKKQFYPVYSADDFLAEQGLLTDLSVADLALAIEDGNIVGVVGAWNQQAFRASRVAGYSGWLRFFRPLYNLWASLSNYPALSKPGTVLNYFALSTIAVCDDNQDIFRALIGALVNKYREKHDFMMVGLHDSHPLLPVLLEMPGIDYKSQLFLVYWPDGAQVMDIIDGRPVYLELGSL